MHILGFDRTQGIDRYQFYDFVTNCSQFTASDPSLGQPCSFCDTITFEEKLIKKSGTVLLCGSVRRSFECIFGENWTKFEGGVAKKTENCTFQNGNYCNGWGLNVRYWL